MNRFVSLPLLTLLALTGFALTGSDVEARGHRRHAGCSAAHAHRGGIVRRVLGFERRQARRHDRQARRASRWEVHHGCSGEVTGCGGDVGCGNGTVSEPPYEVYHTAPEPQMDECPDGFCPRPL